MSMLSHYKCPSTLQLLYKTIGLCIYILLVHPTSASAQIPLPTLPAVSTTCDYTSAPANISVNITPSPDAAHTMYFLVHFANGEIIDTSSVDANFTDVEAGQYFVIAAHSDGYLFNNKPSDKIFNVFNSKNCLTWSDAVAIQVCGDPAICDFRTPEEVELTVDAVPPGLTAIYILVDKNNTIAHTSATPSFSAVAEDYYYGLAVYHDGAATGISVGDVVYDALVDENNCIKSSNTVYINVCESCAAGIVPPPLSQTGPIVLSNDCINGIGHVDLNTLHTGTAPTGSTLVWSIDSDKSDALSSVVLDPTMITESGLYYAYYWEDKDPMGVHDLFDCYSPASDVVEVTIDLFADVCDFDGDGIPNGTDIDDDNDGILDSLETAVCVSLPVDKSLVSLTTEITWFNLALLESGLLDGNNSTVTTYANPDGQDIANLVYLAFDLGIPTILDTIEIVCSANDILDPGAVIEVQGSHDNTSWDDLYTYTSVDADGNTGILSGSDDTHNFPLPSNTTKYQYYRLYGVSGTTNNWQIIEVNFSEGMAVFCDIDGDGIQNKFDLDSDGDGCPDALESGIAPSNTDLITADIVNGNGMETTGNTTTSTDNAQLDPNGIDSSPEDGLNDSVDTNGNGKPDYTSTYTTHAIDANAQSDYCPCVDPNLTAANCDFDGDGILNIDDIDDDNDGILDHIEDNSSCIEGMVTVDKTNVIITSQLIWIGAFTGALDNNNTTNGPYPPNNTALAGVTFLTIDLGAPTILKQLELVVNAANGIVDDGSEFIVEASPDGSSWAPITGTISVTRTNGIINTALTNCNNFDLSTNGTAYQYFRLQGVSGLTVNYWLQEVNFGAVEITNCDDDEDNDGFANSLDLDSDGDGCYDRFESGIANTTTDGSSTDSLVIANNVTTGVGDNGFADAIEVGSESGTYDGTYTYTNAIDDQILTCPQPCTDDDKYADNCDFDGDGINNDEDLDDDNDGVLDTEEIVVCSNNTNPISSLEIPAGTGGIDRDFIPFPEFPGTKSFKRTTTGTYAGWTIIAGEADLMATDNVYFWQTAGGIMLDGGSTDSKLSTTITTISGQAYDFIVYHAKHPGSSTTQTGTIEILDGANSLSVSNITSTSSATSTSWHEEVVTFVATSTTTTITLEQTSNNSGFGSIFSGMGFRESCIPITNSDDDSIPNRFDLDSDNDGCSDAFEAGVTTSTDVNFQFPTGNQGDNGFEDSIEDGNETGNYNGNYTYANAIDDQVTDCPSCDAGTAAPILSDTAPTNTCPTTTVNLTAVTASNTPSGTITLEWHSIAAPTDNTTLVATPNMVAAGTYFAIFHDTVNDCYSPSTEVTASIEACCAAGIAAPTLSTNTLMNICDADLADLTSITASNTPTGTITLEWHTSATVTDNTNLYATPSTAIAGAYYTVFHDTANDCYSPVSAVVTVSIVECCAVDGLTPPLAIPGGN